MIPTRRKIFLAATGLLLLMGWPLPVCAQQVRVTQAQVNRAIDRGLAYLVRMQYPDGSFSLHHSYPVGSTALALYTMLKCGLDREHQAVRRALAYALSRPEKKTYSHGCLLLALATLDPQKYKERIFAMARELLEWQQPSGIWGYPSGTGDFSNTQYALLGLWAAGKAGFQAPVKHLRRAVQVLCRPQTAYGGWRYRPQDGADRPITGSMTAAGAGSLGLILELAGRKSGRSWREKLDRGTETRARGHLERGLDWFKENFSARTNPVPKGSRHKPSGTRYYYYLYGVERLGAFAKRDLFGRHDWYWEGADRLVEKQSKRDGFWSSWPGDPTKTCFALLFLRRATRPVTDYSPNRVARLGGKKQHDFEIRARGEGPVEMWVSSWPPHIKSLFGWADGKLRIAWVRWLSNGREIAKKRGDSAAPLSPSRASFPHRQALAKNGTFRIKAEAELVDARGRRILLESNQTEITLDHFLTEELAEWLVHPGANLLNPGLPGLEWEIRASSSTGGNGPEKAVDH